jgi:hypothetical protein
VVGWAMARLRVYLGTGDITAAAGVARSAAAGGTWSERAPVLVVPMVEAFVAADCADEAARALPAGAGDPDGGIDNPWLRHAAGLVAGAHGEDDAALAWLAPAGDRFRTAGYTLDAVRVDLARARALRALGKGAEARAVIGEARRAAAECGAVLLESEANGAR